MASIRKQVTIDVPADTVWAGLREYGALHEFATGFVIATEMDGTDRLVTFGDGTVLRERLIAMTVDFSKLWADPDTPNRERKRLLAHIIEDVTLIKMPAERTTKIHVRFKGGKIQTLTTMSPKSSAQYSLAGRLSRPSVRPALAL